MKKSIFIVLFVAMSVLAKAQQWTSMGSHTPVGPQVNLISSSEQQVVVDFTLNGFNLTKVNTPNGLQQIVSVPEMASMLEAGAPDLPQFPIPAIIGDRAEMEVIVTRSAYTDYENIEIAPSKGNFSRQIDPETVPYTYGEMYNVNAFYPTVQAHLEAPYIIRDFRGQNIMVTPFAYNPVTKTFRVYHHMTFVMNKVSDNGQNQKVTHRTNRKISPEMKAAYNHRFINYKESASKYTFVEDRGEMLVICPTQYMTAMQPFVDWKNQSGRPTTMVSLSEVGGNNDTQIKAYIRSIYDDPDRNLVYILLVGDYAELTPHSMNSGYSDNWFGMLEGGDSDYYLEAFTGRFSVESVQDVVTHVEKVLYYERDMPAGLTWLDHGIGIGANEGAGSGHNGGEADYVHIDYIRDTLLHYTYETVTQQYRGVGAGTSASAISADFNAGMSICNYCNHGSQTSWGVASYSNSDVNALVNDDKWPFIWSVACLNGQFNVNCFAEAWLRATNSSTGRPTGAVGGMFSWISQPWTPPMTGQDEMINILTEWKYSDQYNHTFGGASLNGSMYILDMHPNYDGNKTQNTWLLFGDPSLMVRTDNPVSMNVSCNPSTLILGMNSLEVTAENTAFGIATLMMDGEVISTGYIQNGTAILELPPMSNIGIATLTVIGYNKVTEIMDVEVLPAEGAYLTVDGYTPNTALIGENTDLSIIFKNVGTVATIDSTNVTLTCSDPNVTIINGNGSFGALASEATTTVNGFCFRFNYGIALGTGVVFHYTAVNGIDTWEGNITVSADQIFTVNVAANNANYGVISGGGEYHYGQTCTVVATPAEGYMFSGWSQNGQMIPGAASTYSFIVNSDMNLVAHFSEGVLIGDGSTTTYNLLPSYNYYTNSLTEQIYTPAELGNAGLITGIAFYNGGAEKTLDYDFYMKNTTKSSFSSKTDWIAVSNDDKVFSGSVTMVANDWTTITFSTPFVYDGISNVVLVTDKSTYWSGTPHMSCRVFSTSSNQAIYAYDDNVNFDPTSPSLSSVNYNGLLSVKNQIIVMKSGLDGCINSTPTSVEVGDVTHSTANVTWTGFSESYNVQLGCLTGNIQTLLYEDFAEVIPTNWTNTETHPWTIVSGHIQSGNAGVANSTSSISITMAFPTDGTIEFDAECKGEGKSTYYDHCDFYIDDTRELYVGANVSGWNHYSFAVTAGEHTFMWSYTKDNSVNPTGDYFAVDNIEMSADEIIWSDLVSVETAEYTFTSLTPVTLYCVKVQGVCEGVESSWSEIVLFTTTEITIVTQTCALSQGWNWFSANVEITLDDLKAALVEALSGTNITIKSKNNGSTTYNGTTWRGQLTTLDVAQMYRISVSAACEITIEGMPINPAEHPITIVNGANWIAFPLIESMNLNDAFDGFAVSGDVVKSKSNGIATYNGSQWRGTLNTLVPGQGYIYKSAATGTRIFTFPTSTR